ncbi:MAG: response regulator [Calditrichaeota bacterium]|nr:response regulator [Calditrichota bacterium]
MTKIFIIDDDKSVVRLLVEFFEHHKFESKGFFFEKDVITSIREFSPDIILCDLNLGSTSGLQILSELKQNIDLANILFVFLTGSLDETELQKGLELGADDCLIKPIDLYQIKNHIEHIINRTKKENYNPVTLLIDQNEKRLNTLMDFFVSSGRLAIKAESLKIAKQILADNSINTVISTSTLLDGTAIEFYIQNKEILENKYFVMLIDSKEYDTISSACATGINDFIYTNYGNKYFIGKLKNILKNYNNQNLINTYSLEEKSPLHILKSCEKDAFTGNITVISEKGKGLVNMQKGEYKKISFNSKKELSALELISSLTDGEMIVEQHPFQIN